MKHNKTLGVSNDSPTLEEVGAENLPSLVAHWKVGDVSNNIMPDSTGNGYDLELTCVGNSPSNIGDDVCGDSSSAITKVGDFAQINDKWAFLVDVVGTALDTKSNFVVWGCSMYRDTILPADGDIGTLWQGTPNVSADSDVMSGFQFGIFGAANTARIFWDESGQRRLATSPAGIISVGETQHAVGGFEPSVGLHGADVVIDSAGEEVSNSYEYDDAPTPAGTIPASLVAMNGKFGFRGTNGRTLPFKDYYVWSFASKPLYMKETVHWLAQNPGKIPPWWIGV